MKLSLPDAPYAIHVSSLVYGKAPDLPYWEGAVSLDLLLPDPAPTSPVPAVVYLHGGGWRHGDKSAGMYPWHSPLMAANGFVAVNVGYRLTDNAPFPAQAYDAKAAIRWLRANADEYGIDPDRIGVWGDSAGGHLAALLGTSAGVAELEGASGAPDQSSAVQAVVARVAPTDFTVWPEDGIGPDGNDDETLRMFFGGPPAERQELRRLASPISYVHPDVPPFRVVHGTDDETVPFSQAERLVAALREHGADVEFDVVEGGHHNLLPSEEAPWSEAPWTEQGELALRFFTEKLGK